MQTSMVAPACSAKKFGKKSVDDMERCMGHILAGKQKPE
jgi:hypothetical protein